MNRKSSKVSKGRINVPRTRGDEPDIKGIHDPLNLCSPHTRG